MTDLLQFHQWLLNDINRTSAYRAAVAAIVQKDDVVLDIGAGSGILSLFACLAGARKVYAVEQNESIELAKKLCDGNDFTTRIEFIKSRSQNVVLPEPVDVVVSDTGSSFGLQDGIIGTLADARRRFLKPGGQIIPGSVELFVAPVELKSSQSLDIWNRDRLGLDLSAVRQFAVNTNFQFGLEPTSVLAQPERLTTIDFQKVDDLFFSAESLTRATRSGTMHGLGAWINVNLAPGISFTNSPLKPGGQKVDWTQSFFAIETPTPLQVGDGVKARISTSNGHAWRWQVEITDGDPRASRPIVKARFDHSTLGSFPVNPEHLRKQLPDYFPQLSRKGQAESYLLSAFDGTRSIAELTAQLLANFADCFPTESSAGEFVRKIVNRCT